VNHIPLSTPYGRALEAIALMRRERLSLAAAASRAGTTPGTVARLAGQALRVKDGRYVVTAHDTLPRQMAFLFAGGPRWVLVRDSRAASLIGDHGNAVHRYLDAGDEEGLTQLRGRRVRIDGQPVELITDPATLDRLGDAGELHYELYRR
jgi:hypothetical protein